MAVFLLIHKVDLVVGGDRAMRSRELQAESGLGVVPVTVFGSSIHDEALYKVRHPPTFCLTPVSRRLLPPSPPLPLHAFYSSCLG
jgi:hypothetical protein